MLRVMPPRTRYVSAAAAVQVLLFGLVLTGSVLSQGPDGRDYPGEPERELLKGQSIVSMEDYQIAARSSLRRELYDFIASGAWTELTRQRERQKLNEVTLYPRYLRDVSEVDTSKEVLGRRMDYPISLPPIKCTGAILDEGDLSMARACEEVGNIFVLSHLSPNTPADISRVAPQRCRKWIQLYPKPNMTNNMKFIHEAEQAGFEAVAVTIGSTRGYFQQYRFRINNYLPYLDGRTPINLPLEEAAEPYADPAFTWDDLEVMRSQTTMELVVRNVINELDAAEAIRRGFRAIWVSNHGGRLLDSVPAAIEVIGDVMDLVRTSGKKVDVYVDGGVRSGIDALKYYAYGVNAVFMGRPAVYAMALNGTGGVVKALDSVVLELTNAMQLAGYPVLDEVEQALVERPTREAAMQILRSPPPPTSAGMKGQRFEMMSRSRSDAPQSRRRPSTGNTARDLAQHRSGENPLDQLQQMQPMSQPAVSQRINPMMGVMDRKNMIKNNMIPDQRIPDNAMKRRDQDSGMMSPQLGPIQMPGYNQDPLMMTMMNGMMKSGRHLINEANSIAHQRPQSEPVMSDMKSGMMKMKG